jgi:Flp pilus assembly protein TadG
MVFVLLALGFFLLGAMAFAVDFGNLWFHRQAAQNAADAGCTSGAMDILVASQSAATGKQGFTIGTAFDCATTPGATPCEYAAWNGYSGANTVPGNQVLVSFPASDPNISSTTPPLPPASVAAYPFIRVDVVDHVQTFFWGLLSGNSTQDVRAFAVCGALLLQSSTPILVLDPGNAVTLSVQGTPHIVIYGGPNKSIQVNSTSATGVNVGGSASIDLSKGGANLTGSSIGVAGGPVSAPGGISFGTTGSWGYPSAVMSDPFATLCAPGQSGCPQVNGASAPAIPGAPQLPADEKGCKSIPCSVSYHDAGHGCPDSGGCSLYTAGFYGTGITIKKNTTALFDPGLYYVVGGLSLDSNSTVRPGMGAGDGSGGTTFYFSGAQSISVNSNSGSPTTDPFYATSLKCTGTSALPGNVPATTAIQGNILLAPCTGYYGDPLGSNDPQGIQRGMLFFQDRSASGVSANWGGGGQFLIAGIMYFHHCNASGTGKGCGSPATYYDATFSLSGNSCSGTYVLGSIAVDNLTLGGSSCITMDLNPNAAYWMMKASLIR